MEWKGYSQRELLVKWLKALLTPYKAGWIAHQSISWAEIKYIALIFQSPTWQWLWITFQFRSSLEKIITSTRDSITNGCPKSQSGYRARNTSLSQALLRQIFHHGRTRYLSTVQMEFSILQISIKAQRSVLLWKISQETLNLYTEESMRTPTQTLILWLSVFRKRFFKTLQRILKTRFMMCLSLELQIWRQYFKLTHSFPKAITISLPELPQIADAK